MGNFGNQASNPDNDNPMIDEQINTQQQELYQKKQELDKHTQDIIHSTGGFNWNPAPVRTQAEVQADATRAANNSIQKSDFFQGGGALNKIAKGIVIK